MANGKVTRRASITVDLDCTHCKGRGFVYKKVTIGWGPGSHCFGVAQPCECLRTTDVAMLVTAVEDGDNGKR